MNVCCSGKRGGGLGKGGNQNKKARYYYAAPRYRYSIEPQAEFLGLIASTQKSVRPQKNQSNFITSSKGTEAGAFCV